MRSFLLGLIALALGIGGAVLITSPGAGARVAVDGTITGGVNDNAVLSLSVTSVAAGTYEFDITDSTQSHNFDICAGTSRCTDATSLDKTTVGGTGSVAWNITLTPGTYTYQCDAHPSMTKHFTVTDGSTTTTPTTTTTTPALAVKIVATTATRKLVTVKAKASQLSHVTAFLISKASGTQLATAATDGTAVTLRLKPASPLEPGKYIVKVTVECCGTSATRQKTILVT